MDEDRQEEFRGRIRMRSDLSTPWSYFKIRMRSNFTIRMRSNI